MKDKKLKISNSGPAKEFNIFKETDHLRATYKLVTSEERAYLIVMIDETDLKNGVRVISFDKRRKSPVSERKLKVKIRGREFFFDPSERKLSYA